LNAGHYWTAPVFISFALTILLLTCQLGLTVIAGQHIRANSFSFKKNLVAFHESEALPMSMTPIDLLADMVGEWGKDMASVHLGWLKYLTAQDEPEQQCCNGAECAALRLKCCDRSSVVVGSHTRKSNESMFMTMPKGAVEETKIHVGRSRNEMCYRQAGHKLDCTPASYSFLDAWDELDSNGDGLWSVEESLADKANLGCRFGVPVNEMFRSARIAAAPNEELD
jgi:hypothetical protein